MLALSGVPILGLTALYGGGGYVADLSTSAYKARRMIANLIATNWVDYYTRAVFLEFTVYNPNSNIFAHVSYLVEFPVTGGILLLSNVSLHICILSNLSNITEIVRLIL